MGSFTVKTDPHTDEHINKVLDHCDIDALSSITADQLTGLPESIKHFTKDVLPKSLNINDIKFNIEDFVHTKLYEQQDAIREYLISCLHRTLQRRGKSLSQTSTEFSNIVSESSTLTSTLVSSTTEAYTNTTSTETDSTVLGALFRPEAFAFIPDSHFAASHKTIIILGLIVALVFTVLYSHFAASHKTIIILGLIVALVLTVLSTVALCIAISKFVSYALAGLRHHRQKYRFELIPTYHNVRVLRPQTPPPIIKKKPVNPKNSSFYVELPTVPSLSELEEFNKRRKEEAEKVKPKYTSTFAVDIPAKPSFYSEE